MNKPISLLLAAAITLSLSACATNNPPTATPVQPDSTGSSTCLHKLEIVKSTSANCTNPGYITSACTLCGEEFTETFPAVGHLFTDATCTTAKTCDVCGITDGDALGHTYVSGKCEHCGAEMPGYEEQPTGCGHEYSLTDQAAPTCTNEGRFTYSCNFCDNTYTETIAPLGHTFTDATCETAKTCRICGNVTGKALGHNYANGRCVRCSAIDPSVPAKIDYTVTVRSDKGKLIEGVTVSIYTTGDTPEAVGRTNSKGTVTMPVLSYESYTIILSDIPSGYSARERYTFRSSPANINLTTLSQTTPTDHSKGNYKVGSIMGDFTLTDTDGNQYSLSKLSQEKKLVILNFWYVNCSPCKAEFPYFEAINNKYDNVQLLTLNHMDSEKDILALRKQLGVTFPMIVENIGFQEGFGISAYPTTVLIDSSGVIRKIQVGDFKSQEELENLIDNFLK